MFMLCNLKFRRVKNERNVCFFVSYREYWPIIRYSCDSEAVWEEGMLTVTVVGESTGVRVGNITGSCSQLNKPSTEITVSFKSGQGKWIPNMYLPKHKLFTFQNFLLLEC